MGLLTRLGKTWAAGRACAVLLALVLGAGQAGGQDSATSPSGLGPGPLKDRVTDPDRVLHAEDARALGAKLEERFRTRAVDFYLVLRSTPLDRPATDIASELQKTTVTQGVGGVILVSFADNSVSVFLSADALKFVPEAKLQKILEAAASSFSEPRLIAENLSRMALGVVDSIDGLREEDRRKRGMAPFFLVLWIVVGLVVAGALVVGFYVLLQHNLFGRRHFFHERPVLLRYGARMSGGHSAEVAFAPRAQRIRRR